MTDSTAFEPARYWHVQDLWVAELAFHAARGIAPGVGVTATVPLRLVRDRIGYLDLNRQPYVPPFPDHHHRNETPTGIGDPHVSVHLARAWAPWTLAGQLGVSVPLGKTEPNPFELGDRGLPHQHIQFGTGTWGPVVGLSIGRTFDKGAVQAEGLSLLTVSDNDHGYRAGNRYSGTFSARRAIAEHWSGAGGLTVSREEPEKWGSEIEEEGNLGRTDLLLSLGIGHVLAPIGSLGLRVQIPLASHATGEQLDYPWIFSLSWAR